MIHLLLLALSAGWAVSPGLAVQPWPVTEEMTCKSSGMCSRGETKFFMGDIAEPGVLQRALEAVSYKKELILVTIMGQYHMEMLMHLHQDLVDLGFAHILSLTIEEKHCTHVWAVEPELSCVYDSSPIDEKRGYNKLSGVLLMHLRLRFLLRAARLGYNVMNLDSDYTIKQDPYPYLKNGPMKRVHFLASSESGCGINTGFLYVQNVEPDGPVTWLLRHASEKPLRFMDDGFKMLEAWGVMKPGSHMCMTFDQAFVDDAFHSALSGIPMGMWALLSCVPEGAEKNSSWAQYSGSSVSKMQAIRNQEADFQCHKLVAEEIPTPTEWPLTYFPKRDRSYTEMHVAPLHVVNSRDETYEPKYGGRFAPVERGNYSLALERQMKEDCTDCPWWPDTKTEDYEKAQNKEELFGFAPRWFASSAWELRHGYNTPLDGSRPRQVMIHAHVMPSVTTLSKMGTRKVYGPFHYNMSARLNALTPHTRPTGPYMMGKVPADRVLILSPDVLVEHVANHLEQRIIVLGLMQLALLSNRTLVYPDPPCEAGWMFKDKNTSACDGSRGLVLFNRELMPYASAIDPVNDPDGPKKFRFTSPFTFCPACMRQDEHWSAMLGIEFEHYWLQQDAPAHANKSPGPKNVAFLPADSSLGKPPEPLINWSLGEVFVSLKPADALKELRRFNDEPILYVGHPVVVDYISARDKVIEGMDAADILHVERQMLNFATYTKKCTLVFEHPWDYSRKHYGKPEHAVGLPGYMRDDGVHIYQGVNYMTGTKKPWTLEDLEEPLASKLQSKRRNLVEFLDEYMHIRLGDARPVNK